jgi:hypothetical protein
MATGAVQISWGDNVHGREAKGLDVFGAAVQRFEDLAKAGRIHSHKEFFALVGRSGGFMLVEGELEELQKILIEPETIALNAKAESIVHDYEVRLYAGGTDQSVQDVMGSYMGSLQELGYL